MERDNGFEQNVHIVFSMSDAGSIKVSLSNHAVRSEHKVLAFDDFFSIGPLSQLDQPEGLWARTSWKYDKLPLHPAMISRNSENEIDRMSQQISQIPVAKRIYIWCADNAHDQLGLRFVLFLLQGSPHEVIIVNATEMLQKLPEYVSAHQLPYALGHLSKEQQSYLTQNIEHQSVLTAAERSLYVQEWKEWSEEPSVLRIWENGVVKALAEDGLDANLLLCLQRQTDEGNADEDGFVKAGLVISDFYEHYPQFITYDYIEYRIWTLISSGVLSFRGLPGAMHKYSIRL